MNIILYLLNYIQYQHKQICWLLNFICRYIPLKQWAFDDSHSPKYQKLKIDKLPVIKAFIKQALKDLYNINISHQQIANYCKTAAICIKPFVDHYDYKPGSGLSIALCWGEENIINLTRPLETS